MGGVVAVVLVADLEHHRVACVLVAFDALAEELRLAVFIQDALERFAVAAGGYRWQ